MTLPPILVAAARSRWSAAVALLAGGVGAVNASGHPTGHDATDIVLRVAIVAIVTLAAMTTPTTVLVIAGGALTTAASDVGVALSFVALAGAIALHAARSDGTPRPTALAASVGALLANVGLRLTWPHPFGGTALFAGIVFAVIGLTALRRAPSPWRRRVVVGLAVPVVPIALVLAATALSLVHARTRANAAFDAGVAGLNAARDGETAASADHFDRAAQLLDSVQSSIDAWWVRAATVLPVVAQNIDALDGAVDAAAELASTGATVARTVDIDAVRPQDGRVDVDRLASYETPLGDAADALLSVREGLSSEGDPWVIAPLQRRIDDLDRRVSKASAENGRALDAVRVVPSLLGQGGTKRWFLAVLTPSELRGGGGLMGNWGILTATDGKLELPEFRRVEDIIPVEPYDIHVDDEWDRRYLQRFGPGKFPQNVFSSPNLPSSAAAVRQIADQSGNGPIDGVIVVDPFAMAAMLQLTGPITVAGWPEPLTADNAAEILLYRQYEDPDAPGRVNFLAQTTQALFQRLTSGTLPSPHTIVDTLGPMVEQRRLQLSVFDANGERFIDTLGAGAELARPTGDAIGLITHNAAPSKLDYFLRRSLTYDVHVDREGRATATAEVTLRNEFPGQPDNRYFDGIGGGLERGVNRQMVSLYSTLPVTSITVDGAAVPFDASVERGYSIADVFVSIDPGAQVVIRYALAGTVTSTERPYDVEVLQQPAALPESVLIQVNGTLVRDASR